MSLWRYKLLEMIVGFGAGIAMMPVALLLAFVVLQFVSQDNPGLLVALIGLPYILGASVLTVFMMRKLAKRRGN